MSKKKPLSIIRKKGNKYIELGEILFHRGDIYHFLLTISWLKFISLISFVYFILNVIFAFGYLMISDSIKNAQPGSFIDAFAFSVQTMATIGYGAMYPNGLTAHILVSIEVLIGLLGIAMATGLMFARFSRPTARVLFTNVAVISKYNGIPTLMFRVANVRNNWIVEAQIKVCLLLPTETTTEGYTMRRLCDLSLVRNQTPFLALTWMIMHPIDHQSPFFDITEELFLQEDYQILITLTGLDATLSQTIHARQIYYKHDIIWNHRFVDAVNITSDGDRYIEYDKFHDTIKIDSF